MHTQLRTQKKTELV